MLKNGQTCSKNLAVFTPLDFQSICGRFSTLYMKRLNVHFFSPTKGAEKEKLPPINQTVRLMTDAVAEFSLGNKTCM